MAKLEMRVIIRVLARSLGLEAKYLKAVANCLVFLQLVLISINALYATLNVESFTY